MKGSTETGRFRVAGRALALLLGAIVLSNSMTSCEFLELAKSEKKAPKSTGSSNGGKPAAPKKPLVDHRVEKGDSLWRLAQDYGTTVQEIKDANGIQGDLIRAGETIKIPTDKLPMAGSVEGEESADEAKPAAAKTPFEVREPTETLTITPGVGTQPVEGAPAIPPSLANEPVVSAPPAEAAPMTAEELRKANIRYFSDRPVTEDPNP